VVRIIERSGDRGINKKPITSDYRIYRARQTRVLLSRPRGYRRVGRKTSRGTGSSPSFIFRSPRFGPSSPRLLLRIFHLELSNGPLHSRRSRFLHRRTPTVARGRRDLAAVKSDVSVSCRHSQY